MAPKKARCGPLRRPFGHGQEFGTTPNGAQDAPLPKPVLAPITIGPLIKRWMTLDIGRTRTDTEPWQKSGRLAAGSGLDRRYDLDDWDLATLHGT